MKGGENMQIAATPSMFLTTNKPRALEKTDVQALFNTFLDGDLRVGVKDAEVDRVLEKMKRLLKNGLEEQIDDELHILPINPQQTVEVIENMKDEEIDLEALLSWLDRNSTLMNEDTHEHNSFIQAFIQKNVSVLNDGSSNQGEHVKSNINQTHLFEGNESKMTEEEQKKYDSLLRSLAKEIQKFVDAHGVNDKDVKQSIRNHLVFQSYPLTDRSVVDSDKEKIMMNKLQEISIRANDLIQTIIRNSGQANSNAHAELSHLLEQTHRIQRELSSANIDHPPADIDDEAEEIWNQLQMMYGKRRSINQSGAYAENAKVRTADIAAWLQHISENIGPVRPIETQMHQQMTPVQQYVLHVQNQSGSIQQNEQIMQQLQQIVTQSGIGKNHAFQQLSITIQPEQLGEMTIKLIQNQGEMIAKITVASQATKQALESNLQQLKHMFAPHQVVIEEQDSEEQQSFDQENPKEDLQDESEKFDEKKQEEEDANTSFEEQFAEILNTKVGE